MKHKITSLCLALFGLAMMAASFMLRADFITGAGKSDICPTNPCDITINQNFDLGGGNFVDVSKEFTITGFDQQNPLSVFHLLAGFWDEKDLVHIGFRCTDASCTSLTGFNPAATINQALFVNNINNLHGLTSIGQVVPTVSSIDVTAAFNLLTTNDEFVNYNGPGLDANASGLVSVLTAHIPEPSTLLILAAGLLLLGWRRSSLLQK